MTCVSLCESDKSLECTCYLAVNKNGLKTVLWVRRGGWSPGRWRGQCHATAR
jgi:hypothetical protein